MTLTDILYTSLATVPGVVAFVELLRLMPVTRCLKKLAEDSGKALAIIRSPNISDHWKEKALPSYSGKILLSSLQFSVYISILALAFFVVFLIIGLLLFGELDVVVKLSYQTGTLVIALVSGTLYALVRGRPSAGEKVDAPDYTFSSRLLHSIALGSRAAKEMAFDMDCAMNRASTDMIDTIKSSSPVFVAGLARAGTTVLLEALYSTGAFSTLTYRDMPFVTAPYLWSRLTKGQRQEYGQKRERAHGDRLYIDLDSPEAFDEVFWLTFSDAVYVKDSCLVQHEVDGELIEKYRRFVANVLARHGSGASLRYLAKNNNNLLRIRALKSAFKNSVVVVPFRNPLDHAKSLHIQHAHFLKMHTQDPFSLKYMNWLGHFEFGANFKPFNLLPGRMNRMDLDVTAKTKGDPLHLDYWLMYWWGVYEFVLSMHTDDVVFLDYDRLCESPAESLGKLGERLSLDASLMESASSGIKPAKKHLSDLEHPCLSQEIRDIHERLKQLAV